MRVPHVPRAQALDDGDEEIAFFPGYDTPGGVVSSDEEISTQTCVFLA